MKSMNLYNYIYMLVIFENMSENQSKYFNLNEIDMEKDTLSTDQRRIQGEGVIGAKPPWSSEIF